jgi:hypothetical protein
MNTNAARRRPSAFALLAAGSLIAVAPSFARDDDDRHHHRFTTELSGFNEVHFAAGPPAALRGAIFTPASGKFRARKDSHSDRIFYELEYQNLVGDVTQAHIHFGQNHTVGGIVVWLCQTTRVEVPQEVASVTPVCPQQGKVTGTIEPFQILPQALQGFPGGDFDALIRALKSGAAYANVHSTQFAPGEIRGQIDHSGDHRH